MERSNSTNNEHQNQDYSINIKYIKDCNISVYSEISTDRIFYWKYDEAHILTKAKCQEMEMEILRIFSLPTFKLDFFDTSPILRIMWIKFSLCNKKIIIFRYSSYYKKVYWL